MRTNRLRSENGLRLNRFRTASETWRFRKKREGKIGIVGLGRIDRKALSFRFKAGIFGRLKSYTNRLFDAFYWPLNRSVVKMVSRSVVDC